MPCTSFARARGFKIVAPSLASSGCDRRAKSSPMNLDISYGENGSNGGINVGGIVGVEIGAEIGVGNEADDACNGADDGAFGGGCNGGASDRFKL
mmetsp:Transcript_7628/g.9714  ORF Transcript_7628/g.9714 Transcript_7628/m.9714 type:complete len:95 (+) Transcript_7628:979-1263(+)